MPIEKEPITEENADSVHIRLGKTEAVRTVETYSFRSSVLTQPSAFSLTLSGGRGARDVLTNYPPGPEGRCALYIGKYRQFTGELDAVNARGDANSTVVEMHGRDMMARLHDTDITGDRTFNGVTYAELFDAALNDVGQAHKQVEFTNDLNRNVRSGTNVKVFSQPMTKEEVKQSPTGVPGKFSNVVIAKMGESWLQFLERNYAKLGIFMWSDANGNFVVSRPNGNQEAKYHFFRKRGQGKAISNVKSVLFTNDTTHRFSSVVIYARNLGKKFGHNHTNGRFNDVEMQAMGFNRRKVYRDVEVNNVPEAEYFARKQIAEINRASYKLQYVISGHSAPILGSSGKRGIIVPDMVARVDDDEIGIHENMYIETVEYHSPPRTTVVTLMRPQDLVFGEIHVQEAVKKAKQAAKKRVEEVKKPTPIRWHEDPNANNSLPRAAVSVYVNPTPKAPPNPGEKFGPAMNK